MIEFSIEDAQILQYRLEVFITEIEGEWKSVITQWEHLKESWQDRQYDGFETFFEALSTSYQSALEEIHEYNRFLQQKISEVEQIPNPEYGEVREPTWNRWGAGEFTKSNVAQLPDNLKGLYYIHAPDIATSKEPEPTFYIGKSDQSIKNRLLSHLDKSSNKNLRKAVASGQPLLFYWQESPTPSYEEALEIQRFKGAGRLKRQRRERKPLIKYLDDE